MKIYFDNCDLGGSRTGPNTFALRLAIGLSKRGHIVADASDYDVAIVFIEKTQNLNLSKPYVHRLDGMWMKPREYSLGMNDNIKSTMELSQTVIFQSDFDKKMLSKHLVEPINATCIRNGIEIKNQETSQDLLRIKSEYEKVFVSSANWHSQKRLRSNIELFKKIREQQYKNSCLIVLGNNPDYRISDKGIFYAGSWPHDMCLQVFSISDWMIHCAYLDHCPNTCVESISQGCPIICTSEGGTKELVSEENGIVFQEETFNFELVDYDNPPDVDFNSFGMLPENFRANPQSVDIEKVLDLYESVLKKSYENFIPGFRNRNM